MLAWLPFALLTLGWITGATYLYHLSDTFWLRLKRLGLLTFIWVLTAFCYTPTSYNFGSTLILHYIQWGPVTLNVIPFQQMDLEFWLNVLLTVPLGGLLGWNFSNWSWRQIIMVGLLTGLCLEGGQFILDWLVHIKRWVDVDDVITNWAGVIIGYAGYRCFRHLPGFKWLQN